MRSTDRDLFRYLIPFLRILLFDAAGDCGPNCRHKAINSHLPTNSTVGIEDRQDESDFNVANRYYCYLEKLIQVYWKGATCT